MSDVLSWIRLPGPFLIGHRGAPLAARENTLPAFEAALEAGCDAVELDVRLTRDGVPVVHHDAEVRTAGEPVTIAGASWADLSRTPLHDDAGSYTLPRLEQVLDALSGRALVNVEIKPPIRSRRAETAEAVRRDLDRVRPRESVLVSSFDPDLLGVLRLQDRGLFLGFLFSAVRDLNHLEESEVVDGLVSLHPRHDLIDSGLMKRARERKLAVHAWTVDDPAEAGRLVSLGVDGVITNRPDRVGPALFS